MAGTVASPCTTASARTLSTGRRLPSTSTLWGSRRRPSTARRMASRVACRMLRLSISSTLAHAIEQHRALAWISSKSCSRRVALSFLESASPLMGCRSSKMTAAANTGPASGPRPASSTPASKQAGVSQHRLVCWLVCCLAWLARGDDLADGIGR